MKNSENTVDEILAEKAEESAQTEPIAETLDESGAIADESFGNENSGEKADENLSAESDENLDDERKESADQAAHADKGENFGGNYEAMLTTVDNPFDPFDKFDDWFRFDEQHGYHSCAYLGRIAEISDEMSDEEAQKEIERAIDEILKYDVFNVYRKVRRPVRVSEDSAETLEISD